MSVQLLVVSEYRSLTLCTSIPTILHQIHHMYFCMYRLYWRSYQASWWNEHKWRTSGSLQEQCLEHCMWWFMGCFWCCCGVQTTRILQIQCVTCKPHSLCSERQYTTNSLPLHNLEFEIRVCNAKFYFITMENVSTATAYIYILYFAFINRCYCSLICLLWKRNWSNTSR